MRAYCTFLSFRNSQAGAASALQRNSVKPSRHEDPVALVGRPLCALYTAIQAGRTRNTLNSQAPMPVYRCSVVPQLKYLYPPYAAAPPATVTASSGASRPPMSFAACVMLTAVLAMRDEDEDTR